MLTLLWILYFASTVAGYLAMKQAGTLFPETWLQIVLNFWGVLAFALWGLSGLAFSWILGRQSLHTANSFSSLRVLLISVAAFWVFSEPITVRQLLGLLLIFGGMCLAA